MLGGCSPQYTQIARRAGAGETQEALLEWLYLITRSFGVRTRCVAAAPESGEAPLSGAKKAHIGRIILSCNRRKIRGGAPLCAESNGAIIDARTWGLLVVPAPTFALQPSVKKVDRGLSAPSADFGTGVYDIVQIRDGTVVNLYCWDHPVKGPIWCLSTSNGYDVSHLKWRGRRPMPS